MGGFMDAVAVERATKKSGLLIQLAGCTTVYALGDLTGRTFVFGFLSLT